MRARCNQLTADNALAVSHDGDSVADHVRYTDTQQFLALLAVPQSNVLRRAGGHQLAAAAEQREKQTTSSLIREVANVR